MIDRWIIDDKKIIKTINKYICDDDFEKFIKVISPILDDYSKKFKRRNMESCETSFYFNDYEIKVNFISKRGE